jgi:hypothetical protein
LAPPLVAFDLNLGFFLPGQMQGCNRPQNAPNYKRDHYGLHQQAYHWLFSFGLMVMAYGFRRIFVLKSFFTSTACHSIGRTQRP